MDTPNRTSSYIYNLEIMIEDTHHASALAQLLQKLNQCQFIDYKVLSGIQLGKQIDSKKAEADTLKQVPVTEKKSETEPLPYVENGFHRLHSLMKSNKLIRLIVNKGLGIKLSIPCRIINIEDGAGIVTVYHVDEKQVYTFRLTEIEDYIET